MCSGGGFEPKGLGTIILYNDSHQLDFLSLGQLVQRSNDRLFRAVWQKINDTLVFDITEYAVWFRQVNFIDAKPDQRGRGKQWDSGVGCLAENKANGFLIQSRFLRNAGKGAPLCCLFNVVY